MKRVRCPTCGLWLRCVKIGGGFRWLHVSPAFGAVCKVRRVAMARAQGTLFPGVSVGSGAHLAGQGQGKG